MKLVITGCGRSGTRWAARSVSRFGLPCTHEQVFTSEGVARDVWTAESSSLAVPFLPLDDTYTVHLVRHPLRVIASIVWRGGPNEFSLRFLEKHAPHIPQPPDVSVLEHATAYWYDWNRSIQALQPNEVARLENVSPRDVRRWVGAVRPARREAKPPGVSNASRGRVPRLAWKDIPNTRRVKALARELGYRT